VLRRAAARDVYAAAETTRVRRDLARIPERVYVPNTGDNTVDVIDAATFTVVDRFAVGTLPHHITPAWNLRWLYVDDTVGNTLVAIDPSTARPVRTIPVADPYNLYFSLDGTKAIVVAERSARLDFRNPHTWRLIKSVSLPGRGADHLDFSRGGAYLVLSDEFSGDVVKVDVRRMRVVDMLRTGGLPVDVKLAPRGSLFYVADQARGGVLLLDGDHLREIGFLATGSGAHGLCVSRDGKHLYVSNRLAGSISVIDFARRRVTETWQVGGSPDMMQVSPDGRMLWVSNRYNASVSVISTVTGRVLHTIAVGPGPHGLSYFPEPGRFSLGHNGVYR
jgi:YVTN family beta-propeller protein